MKKQTVKQYKCLKECPCPQPCEDCKNYKPRKMKKSQKEYDAYALMYSGILVEGFCQKSNGEFAIFLDKKNAQKDSEKWGPLKPKIVKVKIVV